MMRRFLWSIRRELWESRWIYLAPLGMAAVILLGFVLLHLPHLATTMSGAAAMDATHRQAAITDSYDIVALLMMLTGLIAAAIYSVDALYGERRDRSVMFWKSLPVTDTETVLAKLCIPVLVIPLMVWGITVAVHVVMLLVSTAVLVAHGMSAGPLWQAVAIVPNDSVLLFHLVAIHGLLPAPIYAWLLLVSAWAPRAPFAWAVFPPVAIGFLERVSLGTTKFAMLLGSRFTGGAEVAPAGATSGMRSALMVVSPLQFVAEPGLWIGLALAGAMVWLAVRRRRSAVVA